MGIVQMKKRESGLTVVELVTAVTILGLSLAIAIPLMENTLGRKNIDAVGRIFEQSINYARTEAAKLGQIVEVKPSSNTRDWSEGWRLEATNASGSPQLIREFEALTGDIIFDSPDFNGASPIEILPNGQVQQVGTLYLYYADCETGNGLVTYSLFVSGMLRKQLSPCGGTP